MEFSTRDFSDKRDGAKRWALVTGLRLKRFHGSIILQRMNPGFYLSRHKDAGDSYLKHNWALWVQLWPARSGGELKLLEGKWKLNLGFIRIFDGMLDHEVTPVGPGWPRWSLLFQRAILQDARERFVD